MRLVSDSGPILSFARAHRLDVLNAVVEELFIPEAVHDDIVVAGRGRPGADDVAHAVWIKRAPLADLSAADHLQPFHPRGWPSRAMRLSYRAASLAAVTGRVKVPMVGDFPFAHLA